MDTTPEAEELYFSLLKKKSPADRLQMVSSMNIAVRQLLISGLRVRNKGVDEEAIKIKLATILHGEQFANIIASRLRRNPRDVLGMFNAAPEELDIDYLRKMSSELGVKDLIEQLIPE